MSVAQSFTSSCAKFNVAARSDFCRPVCHSVGSVSCLDLSRVVSLKICVLVVTGSFTDCSQNWLTSLFLSMTFKSYFLG